LFGRQTSDAHWYPPSQDSPASRRGAQEAPSQNRPGAQPLVGAVQETAQAVSVAHPNPFGHWDALLMAHAEREQATVLENPS
jgi:hypothetical protein